MADGCAIYMEHADELVGKWLSLAKNEMLHREVVAALANCAGQLEAALFLDQHDLYHDGAFVRHCPVCDKQRQERQEG